MPAAGTRSGSSRTARAWVVPEAKRGLFSQTYGPVYAGADAERRIASLGLFATCGDMVTAQALSLGKRPLVGIVDYKTRRNEPVDPARFRPLAEVRSLRVQNPAGTLTEALRTAVRDLVRDGGGLIVVDGEEDLGALALVEAMPVGATVIYGIPGAGVSLVKVDAETQERVRQLIDQMELRSVDLGA